MSKSKSIQVIKLSNNDDKPKYDGSLTKVELEGEQYILWGENHCIMKLLLETITKSSLHGSIIYSLSEQYAGYGFELSDINGNENKILKDILERKNESGDTWNDVLRKVSFDFAVFESFAIEVHWNINRTRIVDIYHVDYSQIACGKADEYNRIKLFYHNADWECGSVPTPVVSFDPDYDRSSIQQLLVYRKKQSGKSYYCDPEYISALSYIDIDELLKRYKLKGLKNGFTAGIHVKLMNGIPDNDVKGAIEQELIDGFVGEDNNEALFVSHNEDQEHATQIEAIPTHDVEAKYGNMSTEKVDEILWAHRIVNPMLVGVKTATGFSNNADEIKTAYDMFYRQKIEPKQRILSETFTELLKYSGYDWTLTINPALPFELEKEEAPSPQKKLLDDINSLSPLLATKLLDNMTQDEIRGLVGLPAAQTTPQLGATNSIAA